ncbi:MAG: TonB-dependent receptor domain-containing protein, partial [Opitutaceae bacterium]
PYPHDIGATNTDASLRSVSGGAVWVPDVVRLDTLFRENPQHFTHTLTAANYYTAFVANRRHYEEEIDAAFVMATATVGRATLRAGLRREATDIDAEDFDSRSPAELAAAGFAETNGRATTIPGLEYQFFSKPKIHRTRSYDNLFPSASLKYRFTRNFDAHFGFSSTIRRPPIHNLAGVWVINDDALTVTAPNPALVPERSRNFSARLAYYFEPIGLVAVNAFQNNVRGLFISDRLTAQEFGNTDPALSNYNFITTIASADEITMRGMEYEYSQSLSFLPSPFNGLNVRASYTRNYAAIPRTNLVPHAINAGVSYGHRRLSVYASMNWRDDYALNLAGTRLIRRRAELDIGGSFRCTQRLSVFFSARNLANEPLIVMETNGANPAVAQTYDINGTSWTFGVKSVW